MKTITAATAVAGVLLALTACGDAAPPVPDAGPPEAPEVAAALDWIAAAGMEFGAAPFSPPGWPYRIGDEIDRETSISLHKRFPDFLRARAVTWIDGRPFGAVIGFGSTRGRRIYKGHFPVKSRYDEYRRSQRVGTARPLPPGARLDLALGDRFEAAGHLLHDSLDVLRARWHEPFAARFGKGGGR